MFVIVALKAQKRIAQGKAYHVGDGRAESAKAWITAVYLTLLRFGFYDNTSSYFLNDNTDNNDNGKNGRNWGCHEVTYNTDN